ncbi:helix-turn-helix domain-containing protein [Nocardia asiatica]|uniref:helix-turn-helix domain-containing protein n=1 Tax=Nocardia asiatica TaxID=209252 RepID=UPI0002E8E5AB|nr:helix-turn-helix domain-containing protein [Nocardia asiatica]
MNGGYIEEASAEPPQKVLGSMIKELRDARAKKQAQVARMLGVTVSSYSKWEEGARRPLMKHLAMICDVLGAEAWKTRKMMALLNSSGTLYGTQTRTWPLRIAREDIEVIEAMPYPALYRTLPEQDIVYANNACLRVYPMFAHQPYDSPHPANMVEAMLTDWRARELFVDWERLAHRWVYMMRLWSRGVAGQRLEEIVSSCSHVPEFDDMWRNEPPPQSFATNRIAVRRDTYPDAPVDHYVQRAWFPNDPHGELEIFATPPVTVAAPSSSPLGGSTITHHPSMA